MSLQIIVIKGVISGKVDGFSFIRVRVREGKGGEKEKSSNGE